MGCQNSRWPQDGKVHNVTRQPHTLDRKADRFKPVSAAIALVVGACIIVMMRAFTQLPLWGLGIMTILVGLYVANVALGGGLDETPLHAFGRVRRLRADPRSFGKDDR
jgi:archaellum biogenesis protein FlaJ (TadC family)